MYTNFTLCFSFWGTSSPDPWPGLPPQNPLHCKILGTPMRTGAVIHGTRTPNMCQRYCMMATPSPVYLFKHVKHGIQNIQNDCHQWLSDSFRVQAYQICFRPGLYPGPRCGSLQRTPDSLAVLRGPNSKGERKRVDKEKGWEGKRKGRGRTGPLSQMSGSAPGVYWTILQFFCCSLFVVGGPIVIC